MTFKKIKEDYARGNGWKNWDEMYGAMVPHNQQLIYEEAARRYAKAKWEEACEAMRSEIIGQWNCDAASEFDGINDTTPPKFKP